MITSIGMKNFRSIESADIALSPLTVLYGPTASGKSSLLYATQVIRNFVLNPNRQADGYFHLGFMDLGGFDACVFNHDAARNINITITHDKEDVEITYGLTFGKTAGTVQLKSSSLTPLTMKANVAIPYGLNQSFPFTHK